MKESLYDIAKNRLTSRVNTGYDYKGNILQNSMSPYLFKNPVRAGILAQLENVIYFLVEKAKYIKTFYNYSVDKNYKDLN